MKHINIEKDKKTPEIIFNEKELKINGRSCMEGTVEWYKPILASIRESLFIDKDKNIDIHIHFEYIDNPSEICLLDIFRLFEKYAKNGNTITVYWHYDFNDDDMENKGKDFEAILELPFKFVVEDLPKKYTREEIVGFNINDWTFRRSSGYPGYDNVNKLGDEQAWIYSDDYDNRKNMNADYVKDLALLTEFGLMCNKEQELNLHQFTIDMKLVSDFLDNKYFG